MKHDYFVIRYNDSVNKPVEILNNLPDSDRTLPGCLARVNSLITSTNCAIVKVTHVPVVTTVFKEVR